LTRSTSDPPEPLERPRSPPPISELLGATGDETRLLADRLRERFGSEVDPGVALEPAAPGDLTSEILQRLSSRPGGFGRYRLQEEIAKGGQGVVLRVWDEDLHRHLAMKVLLGKSEVVPGDQTPPVDSRSLGRFLEEAQVTGQLDHPGIVPIHELGLDAGGRVYFTMKLVKGRTLKEIFELVARGREGWTRTRALSVLLKVCEAMAYAHHKGVVHRDLKPANVMVGRFGEVFVMDWGLARVLGRADPIDLRIVPHGDSEVLRTLRAEGDSDSPLVTMDGHVVGTPAYMSPEQAHGRMNEVGPPSDVYAAGAMLYHLLAGHPPYVKLGLTIPSHVIWYRVQEGPPEPLATQAPDAPPELVAICEKAMARGWHARYRDMGELAADLTAYLEQRVVHAYEGGPLAEMKKWIQRNRPLAAALGMAAGLLVTGLLALALKARSDRNAALAKEREGLALTKEAEARAAALRERTNVLQLSALRRLDDLEAEAAALWSLDPSAYDSWLARARELVAGLETRGDVLGHRDQLARLRERGLPLDEATREAGRRSHPRFGELERLRAELAALRRADDVRQGRAPPPVWMPPASFFGAGARPSVSDLADLAKPLTEVTRSEFGHEAEGLAYARLAMEAVDDEDVQAATDTGVALAWALFANGLDEEAFFEMQTALSLAPAGSKQVVWEELDSLRKSSREAREGKRLLELQRLVPELEAELGFRRAYSFEREEDAWWHDQLAELVDRLEAFADPETGLIEGGAGDPERGIRKQGIAGRQRWARDALEGSLTSVDARRRWSEALEAIADPARSPAYGGLRIEPQAGLLPLGPDPRSGLWEFAHLPSGAPAWRDESGELVLGLETGLVLVLVPGGVFWMGAQHSDPAEHNFDPDSAPDEQGVHAVTLSPFFLSKYEMTQAQWLAFVGKPSVHSLVQEPVERVDWQVALETLACLGLSLPSEAQWEYAARAGTETPWWTGNDPPELPVEGSLSSTGDRRKSAIGGHHPNPYGIHGVLGNVSEWCLDGYDATFYEHSPTRDPVCDPELWQYRVIRGGAYDKDALAARSARRNASWPTGHDQDLGLGLRPARALTEGGH
jgi:serine/threonine protein kinase/formylglycine-generating enzyme required for sulfatase activity